MSDTVRMKHHATFFLKPKYPVFRPFGNQIVSQPYYHTCHFHPSTRKASWYRSWPSPILGDLSYDVTFTTIYKLLPSCEVVPYFRGILAPNFVMSSLLLGGRRKDRQYPVAPLTTPPTGPCWQNRVPSLHLQGKSCPGRASSTMAEASVSVCEAAEVRPFLNLW